MIKFESRFDEYAYRIANGELDPSVTNLIEGQWVTKNNGKVVIADGTKKAWLCITSKRVGRDQLSGKVIQQVSFLHGAFFGLKVDQFDAAGTYNELTPLKVKAGGVLTPWVAGTDSPENIVAYALGAPVGGFLAICSK
jgi:hypothetical protein